MPQPGEASAGPIRRQLPPLQADESGKPPSMCLPKCQIQDSGPVFCVPSASWPGLRAVAQSRLLPKFKCPQMTLGAPSVTDLWMIFSRKVVITFRRHGILPFIWGLYWGVGSSKVTSSYAEKWGSPCPPRMQPASQPFWGARSAASQQQQEPLWAGFEDGSWFRGSPAECLHS